MFKKKRRHFALILFLICPVIFSFLLAGENDIIDEAIYFFKANIFFRNYEIKVSIDRKGIFMQKNKVATIILLDILIEINKILSWVCVSVCSCICVYNWNHNFGPFLFINFTRLKSQWHYTK